MGGRTQKKQRREMRAEIKKAFDKSIDGVIKICRPLPLGDRVRIAWRVLRANKRITVKKGYCWGGCSSNKQGGKR